MQENQISGTVVPDKDAIRTFAEGASKTLYELNFDAKRAIVVNVLDKVIGTQQKLEVYGYVPLSLNHVKYKTENRHRGTT